jgi:hypothetical protein
MDDESPKDKLLEACGMKGRGAPPKAGQGQEGKKLFEALLDQAENASAAAHKAQCEAEKTYQRLTSYLQNELPPQLVNSFEKTARREISQTLNPLDDSVHRAVCSIDSCAESLAKVSWNCRLMGLSVLLGFATVMVGAAMVRCTLLDDSMAEAQRYEVYGRKVEANIERYKPKDREKLYRCVGGRP